MINSIYMEKDRYEAILQIVASTDLKVVAQSMNDEGMSKTVDDRMVVADQLINGLLQNDVCIDNI